MRVILFLIAFLSHVASYAQIGLPIQQSVLPKNSLVVNYDFSKSTGYTRGSTTVPNLASTTILGNAALGNAPTFMNSLGYISFNGFNQYLVTSNIRSYFKSLNTSVQKSFSMSFWIYPTDLNGVLVSELESQVPDPGFGFQYSNIEIVSGIVKYRVYQGTPVSSNNVITLNNWHHIAMVYDGSTLKGYLNGVLQGSQTYERYIPSSSQNYGIGSGDRAKMGTGAYGKFNLAQFKLYNLPLSDNDIQQEYELKKDDFDYTIHSPSINSNPVYWNRSSVYNAEGFGSSHYTPWLNSGLGWAAGALDLNQWISLSYDEPAVIKGLVVQGRLNGGQLVTKANVETSLTGSAPWTRVLNDVDINNTTNPLNDVRINLPNNTFAKAVRIAPTDYSGYITLRMGMLVKPNNYTSDGLVLNLDASNLKSYIGTGTNWNDLSGSLNNGVLNANVAYNNTNGGILSFNGSSSQVTIADNASLEPGSNDWTMEAWVNSSSLTAFQVLLGKFKNGGTANDVSYGIRINAGRMYAIYGNGTVDVATSDYTVQQNSWYHVVYVFKSGQNKSIETYINGTLIYTDTHTLDFILNTSNSLYLGSWNNSEIPRSLNAKLGAVRLYNRALSSSEVLNNFNVHRKRFGL